MTLQQLLAELGKEDGSDLHLVVGQPPVFRIGGALIRRTDGPVIDAATMDALLLPNLNEAHRAALAQGQDVERTLRVDLQRYRFHIFRERGYLAASLRRIPNRVPTLERLGFDEENYGILYKLTKIKRGLMVIAGPTGSGKSTTAAAMIEEINRDRAERIITIEDPIEYEFTSDKSLISQRTVGEDVPTFVQGLRSAMREDPDVLLIGDMRDLETMLLALTLAETGHLVFLPLHVNSAEEAVRRLIEAFPESHQPTIRQLVANNLQSVVSQILVPKHNQPGRVAALEIMVCTPRIRRIIAEGRYDLTVAIEAEREIGMRTRDDDLLRLADSGVISRAMAWWRLDDKSRLPYPLDDTTGDRR